MSVLPLFAIIRKDLRVFLTDRRAVILSFAAPLLLAAFFAFAFGAMDADDQATRQIRDATFAHVFTGLAVQFLLLSAIEAGVGLLLERQKGLWRRIQAAPVSRWTLLIGRALSGTMIALSVLAVLFGSGVGFFGIRVRGSVLGLMLIGLTYAMTTASLGLLIAALGKTPQAARSLSVFAVLIMVMLGGAWLPTTAFPAWLQPITQLIPTRWAVDGFNLALSPRGSLVATLPDALALLLFAIAFSVLAVFRFRWEPE